MRSTRRCCNSVEEMRALGSDFPWASGAGASIPSSPESSTCEFELATCPCRRRWRTGSTARPRRRARRPARPRRGARWASASASSRLAAADDEVLGAPLGLVALGLELLGELARRLGRSALDAHLPRGEAAVELLLLPRLAGRLVVPAVFLVDPVLDPARARLDAVLAELGLDDRVRLLGCRVGCGVDEDRVVVARDREPLRLQLVRELARLDAEVAGEPVEEARARSSSSTSIVMRQSSFAMCLRA